MADIENDAAVQITGGIGSDWVLNDPRFDRVRPWIYLLIQMNDSELGLKAARKYNDDTSLSADDQILLGLGLFRSAIVVYGKCYADSGTGRSSLDRNNVFKGKDDLKEVHDRMIFLRNSYVAHNGNNDVDTSTIAVLETENEVKIKNLYTVSHPLNEYDDFLKVVAHCKEYLVFAINKHLNNIQQSINKPIVLG